MTDGCCCCCCWCCCCCGDLLNIRLFSFAVVLPVCGEPKLMLMFGSNALKPSCQSLVLNTSSVCHPEHSNTSSYDITSTGAKKWATYSNELFQEPESLKFRVCTDSATTRPCLLIVSNQFWAGSILQQLLNLYVLHLLFNCPGNHLLKAKTTIHE